MSKRVAKLKEIATNMNDELKKQETIANELEDKIDKVHDKIQTQNKKLQDTLDKYGGTRRFITILIFLIIIIACIGLIYLVVQNFLVGTVIPKPPTNYGK